MRYLYHVELDIAKHYAMTAAQTYEYEQHNMSKLAHQFVPYLQQTMDVVEKNSFDQNKMCQTLRATVVMMPLKEFQRMLYAAQQVDERYRGIDDGRYHYMPKPPEPLPVAKKEFDPVEYLKNYMKTPR